jgi:hypothetical protein
MANGVEQRAQIDTETFKGLLVINGGGAVSLLAIFSQIISKVGYEGLARAVMVGVLFMAFGLVVAVVHNYLRRRCSHIHSLHNMAPPPGRLFGFLLTRPTVCWFSLLFMWLSLASFILGASYVAWQGIVIV